MSKNQPAHSPEEAWFTGLFNLPNGKDGGLQSYRLYVYPGKGSHFPADIRSESLDSGKDVVFEGRAVIAKDQLVFSERANFGQSNNPEWMTTLTAVRATEDSYLGGPETSSGLFQPQVALQIAKLRVGSSPGVAARAREAQLAGLLQKGQPVAIEVEQFEQSNSTIH